MQKTYSETFIVKATECDKFRRMPLADLLHGEEQRVKPHAA